MVAEIISVGDQVAELLTTWLGKHNAKNAVKMFSKRALNCNPEALRAEDLPTLLDALRPMLRTLVGEVSAELVLEDIKKKVH